MKLNVFTVFLIGLFFISITESMSAEMIESSNDDVPILVLDEEPDATKPHNFRTTFDLKKNIVNSKGLASLNIAGSGQFSMKTLTQTLQKLPSPVWIVDLRQESHGFVNGIPISWYSNQNQSNVETSNDNLMRLESMLFNDIGRQSGLIANQILEKNKGKIVSTKEINIPIESASTESALLAEKGVHYIRIGVRDHHAPEDEAVDEFIHFVKTLPKDATLYFHCRGGKGRSTTFMVMYDILRNAPDVPLKDIVKRQAQLGGSDLFTLSEEDEDTWKADEAKERKEFIEKFYRYATDRRGYPKKAWSEWKKSLFNRS